MRDTLRHLVLITSLGLFVSLPQLAGAQTAPRRIDRAANQAEQERVRADRNAQEARPRRMRPEREVLVQTPPVEDPAPTPEAPMSSAAPTIAEDGAVETPMPDGTIRRARPGDCGWTIVRPDGTKNAIACLQVQRSNLPAPDGASATFLAAHGDSLLQIARKLLGGNAASLDHYLKSVESENPDVYERIRLRTDLITKLTGQ